MELIFVCPAVGKVFHSDQYRIMENRGIKRGTDGSRTLDASVSLTAPCPYCGQMHTYHASELACPFNETNKEG
ncbi:MAG: hypothetical protein SWH61_15230 [Thermodesulfobacteriota bacterium]|nr:hypothetical protein [Thermodesulfobacteriota bacterium]